MILALTEHTNKSFNFRMWRLKKFKCETEKNRFDTKKGWKSILMRCWSLNRSVRWFCLHNLSLLLAIGCQEVRLITLKGDMHAEGNNVIRPPARLML